MSDIDARVTALEKRMLFASRQLRRHDAAQRMKVAYNIELTGTVDGGNCVFFFPAIDGSLRVPEPFHSFALSERGRVVKPSDNDYAYDGGLKIRMMAAPRRGPMMVVSMQYNSARIISTGTNKVRAVRRRAAPSAVRRRRD